LASDPRKRRPTGGAFAFGAAPPYVAPIVRALPRLTDTRGVLWLSPIAGLVAAGALAGSAQASVTIGHVLGAGVPVPLYCFPTCTLRQASLVPEDGLSTDGLTSPVNGVVTDIGMNVVAANQDGNLTIRLRVLRGRAGVATSPPATLVDADGIQHFKTSLPIAIGDGIGLDTLPSSVPGNIGIARGTSTLRSTVEMFSPPLLDGKPEQSPQVSVGGVLDMDAVLEPTNTVTFGRVAADRKKGTATVSVTVPNPGTLVVGGAGVRPSTRTLKAPGAVVLKVAPAGTSLKALSKRGKVSLAVKVTFTPTGGAAKTASKTLTLQKTPKKQKKQQR
jgi:hypothetical protein